MVGEPLRVPMDEEADVVVRCPDGSRVVRPGTKGTTFVDVPALAGVFEIEVGGRRLRAMRSLLDARESDLRPRGGIVGTAGVVPVTVTEARIEHFELWPYLALLLVLLLAIEVWWATRREAA
jgi:hypothetical protein